MTPRPRIPLIVVTGFLGSGKTTFINHLISSGCIPAPSIYVNEAGAVGLDQALYDQSLDAISLLEGGCACCYQPGRLAELLVEDLMQQDNGARPRCSHVIVETSGLADPAVMLASVAEHPYLFMRLMPAEVVTVIEAPAGPQNLLEFVEARTQVELADHLFVSKSAAAGKDDLQSLQGKLNAANPVARIWQDLDPAVHQHLARQLSGQERSSALMTGEKHGGPGRPPQHTPGLSHVVFSTAARMEQGAVRVGLEALVRICGSDLIRVKGIIQSEGATPVAVNAVRQLIAPFVAVPNSARWQGDSTLVFFVRNIQPEALHDFWSALTRLYPR